MNELKRFESDLKSSEELRKKLDETVLKLKGEGQFQSDAGLMAAAARALGYQVTLASLEQDKAECEALDPDEMQEVSGGEHDTWCMKDYYCFSAYRTALEGPDGHNNSCMVAWHCMTAFLHTEGGSTLEWCWSNYHCAINSK